MTSGAEPSGPWAPPLPEQESGRTGKGHTAQQRTISWFFSFLRPGRHRPTTRRRLPSTSQHLCPISHLAESWPNGTAPTVYMALPASFHEAEHVRQWVVGQDPLRGAANTLAGAPLCALPHHARIPVHGCHRCLNPNSMYGLPQDEIRERWRAQQESAGMPADLNNAGAS